MNTMHGYGEYSWNDGRRYIGFYNMDKKEGFGIYIWSEENRKSRNDYAIHKRYCNIAFQE